MPARSLWQGSISFGLVNIPIKLYTATNSREYVLINYAKMDIELDTKNGVQRKKEKFLIQR